jgi:hypothetical protein
VLVQLIYDLAVLLEKKKLAVESLQNIARIKETVQLAARNQRANQWKK